MSLSVFKFETHEVRTINKNGAPWFVAADVAAVLEYSEASAMTRHLDADEKGSANLTDRGQEQDFITINESGLYSAILRSRKPEAKRFKKWVTSEVLPSIRKTGSYTAPAAAPDADTAKRIADAQIYTVVGNYMAGIPGVVPGIAHATALRMIQNHTGLDMEQFRRALPAATMQQQASMLNASNVGKLAGLSPRTVNRLLAHMGLQYKNARGEWQLTPEGAKHAQAVPYSNQGHSGFQILWNESIVELLKNR